MSRTGWTGCNPFPTRQYRRLEETKSIGSGAVVGAGFGNNNKRALQADTASAEFESTIEVTMSGEENAQSDAMKTTGMAGLIAGAVGALMI